MTTDIAPSTLSRIPLFRHLNESEMRQVLEVVETRQFAPGDYIIRQGDESRDLWILLEGQCEVLHHADTSTGVKQEPIVLARLEAYNHFGEMSFFHAAPHSADVRARSAVKLLQLTHAEFADMINEGVWAAFKLSHNVVQEMAERLRRMNDWVTELANHHTESPSESEWTRFRSKLFNGMSV
jgi:CRP/FNR family cyclic AMP-dependent transcriptional regulator